MERNDVIMLAEQHRNIEGALKFSKFFSQHKWMVTASSARPTERSAKGNTAGVLVAIKKYLDNSPAAFAIDAEGRLTGNAQLTGRMLVVKWIEILTLAG